MPTYIEGSLYLTEKDLERRRSAKMRRILSKYPPADVKVAINGVAPILGTYGLSITSIEFLADAEPKKDMVIVRMVRKASTKKSTFENFGIEHVKTEAVRTPDLPADIFAYAIAHPKKPTLKETKMDNYF